MFHIMLSPSVFRDDLKIIREKTEVIRKKKHLRLQHVVPLYLS